MTQMMHTTSIKYSTVHRCTSTSNHGETQSQSLPMVEYSVCTLYARRFDASPGRNPTGTGASASGHRSHTEEWWWPAWPCRGSTALVICPCPACPDDHSHIRFSPLLVLPDIILFWSIWFRHSDHGWIHSTLISTVCLVQSSVGLGNSPDSGSSAKSFSHSKLLEFERRLAVGAARPLTRQHHQHLPQRERYPLGRLQAHRQTHLGYEQPCTRGGEPQGG